LTVKDAGRFLDKIMAGIRTQFRALPDQPHTKSLCAKGGQIESSIKGAFKGPQLKEMGKNLPQAAKQLVNSSQLCMLLYKRFRNESIHGAQVLLDEDRFFTETEPYWAASNSDFFGPCHLVEFPAKFLLATLRHCIRTFRGHLLAKGKLPPDVHFHAFGDGLMENLKWLDDEMIAKPRSLNFRDER
jgi:hypothetical protein